MAYCYDGKTYETIKEMADQMIRIEDGRIFSAGVPDGANGGEKDA